MNFVQNRAIVDVAESEKSLGLVVDIAGWGSHSHLAPVNKVSRTPRDSWHAEGGYFAGLVAVMAPEAFNLSSKEAAFAG